MNVVTRCIMRVTVCATSNVRVQGCGCIDRVCQGKRFSDRKQSARIGSRKMGVVGGGW